MRVNAWRPPARPSAGVSCPANWLQKFCRRRMRAAAAAAAAAADAVMIHRCWRQWQSVGGWLSISRAPSSHAAAITDQLSLVEWLARVFDIHPTTDEL